MNVDVNGIRDHFMQDGLYLSQVALDMVGNLIDAFLALRGLPRRTFRVAVDRRAAQGDDFRVIGIVLSTPIYFLTIFIAARGKSIFNLQPLQQI